jgi:hypothetical protein
MVVRLASVAALDDHQRPPVHNYTIFALFAARTKRVRFTLVAKSLLSVIASGVTGHRCHAGGDDLRWMPPTRTTARRSCTNDSFSLWRRGKAPGLSPALTSIAPAAAPHSQVQQQALLHVGFN